MPAVSGRADERRPADLHDARALGKRIAGEEIFSDFRTVEGVSLAFHAEVMRDGRPILKRTLARVTINGPVPAWLFTRPQ